MPGFEYANARLRAMKSRLLSRTEMEALADVGDQKALIAALLKTTYRSALEAAMAYTVGLDCIDQALRNDLIKIIAKAGSFFGEQGEDSVDLVLRAYDIHNLKAILRGLSRNVSTAEIETTLLPVGGLRYATLADLAQAPGVRGAIDLMASLSLPFARPLLHVRTERPGAEVAEMELALDQWHYQDAYQKIKELPQQVDVLMSALKLEADLINLLTVLRFVSSPSERRHLHSWLDTEDLRPLFVGPGRLFDELLERAGNQESLETAIEILSGTPYYGPLKTGLESYARSGQLSDLEKALRLYRLNWMNRLIAKDQLGIGVLLGYLTLKTNEVANIRRIAQGVILGMQGQEIKGNLEYAR